MVSCHICVDLTEGPPPSVTVTAQGTTSLVKGSRFLEAETEQQLVLTPDLAEPCPAKQAPLGWWSVRGP